MILSEDDRYGICKRAMHILRENGLNFEVLNRSDPACINQTFEDYDLPFRIVRTQEDWYRLVSVRELRLTEIP